MSTLLEIVETAAKIIFLFGLGGMAFLFLKKLPILTSLPETTAVLPPKENWFLLWLRKEKEKIKNLPLVKNFSWEIFLQKMLSKTRVLMLKLESKTAGWLEILRKKSQEKNGQAKKDNYWQNLQDKPDKPG